MLIALGTNHTPFFLTFGCQAHLLVDIVFGLPPNSAATPNEYIRCFFEIDIYIYIYTYTYKEFCVGGSKQKKQCFMCL